MELKFMKKTLIKRPRKWVRSVLIFLVIIVGTGITGFILWASSTPEIELEAELALEERDPSRLDEKFGITFEPDQEEIELGFIFYPGGRVSPESYAPMAAELSRQGFLVVIPRMVLNLAVFEQNAADQVIAAYPEVPRWVIGGHSLGGAMAASYSAHNSGKLAGLVLLAAYPPASADLADASLQVLSIYGTQDGLAAPDEINGSKYLLPQHTVWMPITGGNHAGFGYYGEQRGDLQASISKDLQQEKLIWGIVDFFQSRIITNQID
jgi:hypothetical protein